MYGAHRPRRASSASLSVGEAAMVNFGSAWLGHGAQICGQKEDSLFPHIMVEANGAHREETRFKSLLQTGCLLPTFGSLLVRELYVLSHDQATHSSIVWEEWTCPNYGLWLGSGTCLGQRGRRTRHGRVPSDARCACAVLLGCPFDQLSKVRRQRELEPHPQPGAQPSRAPEPPRTYSPRSAWARDKRLL